MAEKIKNVEKAEVLVLKEQVAYQGRQVVSMTIAQNSAVSCCLMGAPLRRVSGSCHNGAVRYEQHGADGR